MHCSNPGSADRDHAALPSVAFYPNHWSVSFEGTMNAPITDHEGRITQSGDDSFFATAIRELDEEIAIRVSAIENIKVIFLNVEYLTLSVHVITLIKVDFAAEEIKQNWLLQARHRDEASKFGLVSTKLEDVVGKLFSRTLWHPSARMRLIQFLFHTYGIDEVAKVIKAKREALQTQ